MTENYSPLGLTDRAALNHFLQKKLLPGFSHYDVWQSQHAIAFTVAKMLDADLLAETRAALTQALEGGTSFDTFKQRLKPYLMAKGWWGEQIMTDPADGLPKPVRLGSTRRLHTIFNTNIQTAHAASRWARIQHSKKALPYLRYNHSAAEYKRHEHRRYYGLILPVEHPLWQQIFPPNGYGCQCSVSQLTRKQAEREGISQEPDIPIIEAVNPRTGQSIKVPAGISPEFAHNHSDRLGGLDEMFARKHGQDALDELIRQRQKWLDQRYRTPAEIRILHLPR